jgi:hypothetical protein
MYGMELVGRPGGGWTQPVLFVLYALISGVLAVHHLRRTEHPILDLTALRIPTYHVSLASGSLFRLAVHSTPFLLPLMFQVPFGMNAFQSGLLILALFFGNFSMKSVTTPTLRRFGFRTVLIFNGVLTAILILSFATLTLKTSLVLIAFLLFVHGLSRSMQFTAINTITYVDVPQQQMSGANALASVVQQLSMGMGVAAGALALRASAWIHGNNTNVPSLNDFHLAFVMIAGTALWAVKDCFGLEPHAGAEVTGHRPAGAVTSEEVAS